MNIPEAIWGMVPRPGWDGTWPVEAGFAIAQTGRTGNRENDQSLSIDADRTIKW